MSTAKPTAAERRLDAAHAAHNALHRTMADVIDEVLTVAADAGGTGIVKFNDAPVLRRVVDRLRWGTVTVEEADTLAADVRANPITLEIEEPDDDDGDDLAKAEEERDKAKADAEDAREKAKQAEADLADANAHKATLAANLADAEEHEATLERANAAAAVGLALAASLRLRLRTELGLDADADDDRIVLALADKVGGLAAALAEVEGQRDELAARLADGRL